MNSILFYFLVTAQISYELEILILHRVQATESTPNMPPLPLGAGGPILDWPLTKFEKIYFPKYFKIITFKLHVKITSCSKSNCALDHDLVFFPEISHFFCLSTKLLFYLTGNLSKIIISKSSKTLSSMDARTSSISVSWVPRSIITSATVFSAKTPPETILNFRLYPVESTGR